MTKNISKPLCGLILLLAVVCACTKTEDTFGEFYRKPETVYIGAADTLFAQSGVKKLRLSVVVNADPKIAKGEIRVNNDPTPRMFEVVRKNQAADTIAIDMDLPEGAYRFRVTLLDNAGNKSLEKTVQANVLGESYVGQLVAKTITGVSFNKSEDPAKVGAAVNLGENYEGLINVRLKYRDSKGKAMETVVNRFTNPVILTDFEAGGEVIAESIYAPVNPFQEFTAKEKPKATLPACNRLAEARVSRTTAAFPETETRKSSVTSFTVVSGQCIIGDVKLQTAGPFKLATAAEGPFESSVSLASVAETKTVFVSFNPAAAKDSLYNGSITVSAANIQDKPVVTLSGKEKGVPEKK